MKEVAVTKEPGDVPMCNPSSDEAAPDEAETVSNREEEASEAKETRLPFLDEYGFLVMLTPAEAEGDTVTPCPSYRVGEADYEDDGSDGGATAFIRALLEGLYR